METEVKFFRLNNGEDVVSEAQETDTSFIFLNPCKIMYLSTGKPGHLSISFMQWVFSRVCGEQVFEIEKKDILFNSIPNESMIKHYWDSVQHFMETESKQKINFDSAVSADDDFSLEDSEEAIEILKEFFDKMNKNTKGRLH